MNAPPRSESYRLADGERKCEWKDSANEKMPNSGTLTINKEDHTVGNLVRMCVPALRPPHAPPPVLRNATTI